MQPSLFNKAVSCAFGKVGKPRTALKDEQLIAIQHVYVCMATDRYDKYTCMSSYRLYLCLASTSEKQKWHFIIADLQATFLHGVAAHHNRISYRIFFCVMNFDEFMENVAKLLARV